MPSGKVYEECPKCKGYDGCSYCNGNGIIEILRDDETQMLKEHCGIKEDDNFHMIVKSEEGWCILQRAAGDGKGEIFPFIMMGEEEGAS